MQISEIRAQAKGERASIPIELIITYIRGVTVHGEGERNPALEYTPACIYTRDFFTSLSLGSRACERYTIHPTGGSGKNPLLLHIVSGGERDGRRRRLYYTARSGEIKLPGSGILLRYSRMREERERGVEV